MNASISWGELFAPPIITMMAVALLWILLKDAHGGPSKKARGQVLMLGAFSLAVGYIHVFIERFGSRSMRAAYSWLVTIFTAGYLASAIALSYKKYFR